MKILKITRLRSFFIIFIICLPFYHHLPAKAIEHTVGGYNLRFEQLESVLLGDMDFNQDLIFHFFEPKRKVLNVPLILQLPELPRGCEVTSLAMLLKYAGWDVNKSTLARQIKKDPTPYQIRNNRVYFGNPNTGFVGNMTTLQQPGLGVYHKPIADLAERYLQDRVIDITGQPFDKVIDQIVYDKPVWVVTNTSFAPLPQRYWKTWQTPKGTIHITYKEHAVVVTGYDEKWIYFNDPLAGKKNRKAKREAFIKAWEQMGSQAISYK